MSEKALAAAKDFFENETQFQLGVLPTEQSNPLTRGLDEVFASSAVSGVEMLQRVDREVLKRAETVLASPEYRKLCDAMLETIRRGGRVIFSGCGATGRLSILLECMWRQACARTPGMERYADNAASIMTGGDFALVRSVESFEDYMQFGARQVDELKVNASDMLVAITEGGETSSVLGTVDEALRRNAAVFLLFNNPADVLSKYIERSRRAIEDPRVTVLDLYCGPMALAGSTRMQATTSEQLIAGGALEQTFARLAGKEVPDLAAGFRGVLELLENAASAIADYIVFEENVYRRNGKITYFADEYLLDIFTDTTERSPTFLLPPFRPGDDKVSPAPWAFVKNPRYPAAEVWKRSMLRALRCLAWTVGDYETMHAPTRVIANPPKISANDLLKIEIGNEPCTDRCKADDAAVLFTCGAPEPELVNSFDRLTSGCGQHKLLALAAPGDFTVPGDLADSPLRLMRHLAVKLLFNTISTGVMVRLGRVTGNWMSFVSVSNKKLIDRGIRLISELGGIPYRESCDRFFLAVEELEALEKQGKTVPPVVQHVLAQLGRKS